MKTTADFLLISIFFVLIKGIKIQYKEYFIGLSFFFYELVFHSLKNRTRGMAQSGRVLG
jgi:hypothetical protein